MNVDSTSLIDRLRKLLRRKGRVRDEADDLIQEAFLRLHEYRKSRQVLEPEAFLVRTVQNLSIDAHRLKARRGVEIAADDEVRRLIDPRPLPDEVLASHQRLQRLRAGLETLAPRTRDVVLLYRIEGLSQSQIATQLGISISSVEKHIAKAALFLSDWMTEDGT
jgi:RNA polymerase sigma factor, sigma-70 family